MITQPAEMMMARRQWHKHFVAQLGSRFIQHPGAEMEDHWDEMVYYRNRYVEFRKSWARERAATALAEAQAENARLRAALVDAGAVAHAYGELTGDEFDAKAFKLISSVISAALHPAKTEKAT